MYVWQRFSPQSEWGELHAWISSHQRSSLQGRKQHMEICVFCEHWDAQGHITRCRQLGYSKIHTCISDSQHRPLNAMFDHRLSPRWEVAIKLPQLLLSFLALIPLLVWAHTLRLHPTCQHTATPIRVMVLRIQSSVLMPAAVTAKMTSADQAAVPFLLRRNIISGTHLLSAGSAEVSLHPYPAWVRKYRSMPQTSSRTTTLSELAIWSP